MINIVRKLLQSIIDKIDEGTCEMSDFECSKIIDIINNFSFPEKRYSKYEACRYLNISRATFDNLVLEGRIPKGTKQAGFKELSWTKKELDSCK